MNRYKSTILAFTQAALDFCIKNEYANEDSVVFSPELKQRVIYIKGEIRDKELLKHNALKLSKPFYFDDGKKYVTVNQDNYKDIDFNKILDQKTNKYDVDPK